MTFKIHIDDFILNSLPKEGPVEIGDGAFIGWHSIILPNLKVGNKAIVKPFSVVTEDVADNQVWRPDPNDILGN